MKRYWWLPWVLFIGACALYGRKLPGPTVYVITQGFSDEEANYILSGIQQWWRAGFEFADVNSRYPGPPAILVTIKKDYDLDVMGRSFIGDHRILIRDDVKGFSLVGTAAHEGGHVLLQTREHLTPGESGVMTSPQDTWELSPADLALACRVVKRCEDYGE